ncbi:unnamed protein product [Candida parapsilosis]
MNRSITFLAFIESQTHHLISADEAGVVVKHNGIRKLRNVYFFSERLFTTDSKIQSLLNRADDVKGSRATFLYYYLYTVHGQNVYTLPKATEGWARENDIDDFK